MKLRNLITGLFVFLITAAPAVHAYEIYPMALTLDETGRGSSGLFRLHNTQEQALTIEASTLLRTKDEDGNDIEVPADEDFVIMPMQAYIEPGEFQVFRVRYLGREALEESTGYRVAFQQLPVDLEPVEGSGIRFLLNIHTLVFVSPSGVEPQLQTTIDFEPLHDEELIDTSDLDLDNPYGVISVTNHGDGFQDLSLTQLAITTDTGDSTTLDWGTFSEAVPMRYILPGAESRISVERLDLDLEGTVTTAEFIRAQ